MPLPELLTSNVPARKHSQSQPSDLCDNGAIPSCATHQALEGEPDMLPGTDPYRPVVSSWPFL